jgi:hypothetical protein
MSILQMTHRPKRSRPWEFLIVEQRGALQTSPDVPKARRAPASCERSAAKETKDTVKPAKTVSFVSLSERNTGRANRAKTHTTPRAARVIM